MPDEEPCLLSLGIIIGLIPGERKQLDSARGMDPGLGVDEHCLSLLGLDAPADLVMSAAPYTGH